MSRINHTWGPEDESGIETCVKCGHLRKKKASAHFNMRQKGASKWTLLYSKKGTKWVEEHSDCSHEKLHEGT